MPENIVLLAGYTRHNTGDWLLVKHGVEVIRSRHPGSRISVLAADPASFEPLGADVEVLGAPIKAASLRPDLLRYAADRSTRGRLREIPGQSAIRHADFAYTCGGGYLQGRSVREVATISAVHVTQIEQAHSAGVPLAMLPQSIGPFEGRAAEAWGRRVLRWFPEAIVRERTSFEYLRAWAPGIPVRQLPDLVFWSDIAVRQPPVDGPARVGLVVRNWWFPGSSNPVSAEREYLQSFARLADHLVERGHTPVLVVHADGPTARGDDRIASRRVREYASAAVDEIEVVTTHDLSAVEATYGEFDVVVSTRMHGALIAVGQGVPTVCVGYEWKARGIFAKLGLGDYVTPIDRLDLSKAVALADDRGAWPATAVATAWQRQRQELRAGLLPAQHREMHVSSPINERNTL